MDPQDFNRSSQKSWNLTRDSLKNKPDKLYSFQQKNLNERNPREKLWK